MAAGLVATADHVQNWWALYALAVSILAALIAWKVFHVSLLQPMEEKAHQQAQYRLIQKQNRFKDIILRQQLAFGKSLLDIGAYETAREEYEEAVKLSPASIDAQLGLHKAKIFSRNSKEFNPAVIERRINMVLDIARNRPGGDDAHARAALGDLFQQTDPEEAKKQYRTAINLDDQVATAHFGLGLILLEGGDYAAAVPEMEKAVEISGMNPLYLNNLGYAYRCSNQMEAARRTYDKALNLDPDHLLSHLEFAQVLLLMKFPSYDACDTLTELIWLMGDDRLLKQEKNKTAWKFPVQDRFLALIDVQEKKRFCFFHLCLAKFLTGDKKGARQELKRALEIKVCFPEDIDSMFNQYLDTLQEKIKIQDSGEKARFTNRLGQFKAMFRSRS